MKRISFPWKTYIYYRKQLNEGEQKVYQALLDGLLEWKKKIQIPVPCDFDRAYELYLIVLRECPGLFHASNKLQSTTTLGRMTVYPDYTMNEQEYWQHFVEVASFLDNCKNQLCNRSEFDTVRILHDAVRKHVMYFDSSSLNEHNILGAILDRKAVCESISKAFKLMCDVNQIPCIYVSGKSMQYIPGKGSVPDEGGHGWNMVRLYGKWYNVDVTWDIVEMKKTGDIRFYYDYFLCSDERFSLKHKPKPDFTVPVCAEDFNLHMRLDKYANSEADIIDITKSAIAQKQIEIVFELSPNLKMDKAQIMKVIRKVIRYVPYNTITYSYNEAMRIFHAELS